MRACVRAGVWVGERLLRGWSGIEAHRLTTKIMTSAVVDGDYQR